MIIHSFIVDEFLDHFDQVRAGLETIEFKDEFNPKDKVVYPMIFRDIPQARLQEIESKLASIINQPILIKTAFIRLSPKGIHAPNFAHTDSIMGQFSVMCYLNKAEHCQGGTAILRHVSGMDLNPLTKEEEDLARADANDPDKWLITEFTPMVENRAFIFRSEMFHAALPAGGFGKDNTDARAVLTVFFDLMAAA